MKEIAVIPNPGDACRRRAVLENPSGTVDDPGYLVKQYQPVFLHVLQMGVGYRFNIGFGTVNLAVERVILIRDAGEMGVSGAQFMHNVNFFGEGFGQFMRDMGHCWLSLSVGGSSSGYCCQYIRSTAPRLALGQTGSAFHYPQFNTGATGPGNMALAYLTAAY